MNEWMLFELPAAKSESLLHRPDPKRCVWCGRFVSNSSGWPENWRWRLATVDGVGSAGRVARLYEEHDAYRWLCGAALVNHHIRTTCWPKSWPR